MGLRTLLLLAAVVLFVVSIFVNKNQFNWLAAGLAVFAGSFLVADLSGGGFGKRLRRRL